MLLGDRARLALASGLTAVAEEGAAPGDAGAGRSDGDPAPPAEGRHTFDHRVAIAALAVLVLLGSWAVALVDPVPSAEISLTRWVNGAPDAVAMPLYPIMQLGTMAAPLVVALAIGVWRRDLVLAAAAVVAGLTAWFGAKAIKQLVGRERPLAHVPGLDVREGDGAGLGFVSGHAAVATAVAVVAMAALPARLRLLAAVLAGTVGIARIVFGVHLPADVVGGWAFGALVGLGAVEVVDRVEARRAGGGAALDR